jgi:hypothetical protein
MSETTLSIGEVLKLDNLSKKQKMDLPVIDRGFCWQCDGRDDAYAMGCDNIDCAKRDFI